MFFRDRDDEVLEIDYGKSKWDFLFLRSLILSLFFATREYDLIQRVDIPIQLFFPLYDIICDYCNTLTNC